MFVFLLMKIGIVIQSYDSSTHGVRTGTSLHEGRQEIVTATTASNACLAFFLDTHMLCAQTNREVSPLI